MKLLPLTLLFLAVLMLSMLGSFLQHRYYLKLVNSLAGEYRSSEYVLASGLRKGRMRGAIAVLVLRRDNVDVIEKAMVMSGATLLARFHERTELTGRIDESRLAGCKPAVRGAIEDALARGRRAAGEAAAAAEDSKESARV